MTWDAFLLGRGGRGKSVGVGRLGACGECMDAPIKHAIVMAKSHGLYKYIIFFFFNYRFGDSQPISSSSESRPSATGQVAVTLWDHGPPCLQPRLPHGKISRDGKSRGKRCEFLQCSRHLKLSLPSYRAGRGNVFCISLTYRYIWIYGETCKRP